MSLRQGSVFSLGSFALAGLQNEDYDDMTDEELSNMLDDIVQKNWTMVLENDLFERYLRRYNPEYIESVSRTLERAKYAQKIAMQRGSRQSRLNFRTSFARMSMLSLGERGSSSTISIQSGSRLATPSLLTTTTFKEGLKVTIPHRMGMMKNQVREMTQDLMHLRDTITRKKISLRAKTEELEIRIREASEAMIDFKENVLIGGIDPITKQIPAEKIVRFIENWMKIAETILERLRLKSTTIRCQIIKAKDQLAQREELGEALNPVDFEQLSIENQDYTKRIEEKSTYLLEMKKIAGHYSIQLTRHKQKLKNLLSSLDEVKREIITKQEQIRKLQSECETLKIDVTRAQGQHSALVQLMTDYTVPDILDFIKLKAEYQELQKTYKRLCRRKKIEEITFKSRQKNM